MKNAFGRFLAILFAVSLLILPGEVDLAEADIIQDMTSIQTQHLGPMGQPDLNRDQDFDGISDIDEVNGWFSSLGGPYHTNPSDADSDNDGLTDGEEQLFGLNPLNNRSPGVYVRYDDAYLTKKFYPWLQYGNQFIAHADNPDSDERDVIMRRGTTFLVGGPYTASIEIIKSQSSLTTLTATSHGCGSGWSITIPENATTGTYTIRVTEGSWSEDLTLHVVLELDEPELELTQEHIDVFAYNDDLANQKDVVALYWDTSYEFATDPANFSPTDHEVYGWGIGWDTDYNEQYVFEDHLMTAIQGQTDRRTIAEVIRDYTNTGAGIEFLSTSWPNSTKNALTNFNFDTDGDGLINADCNGHASIFSTFLKGAGITSRAIAVDWRFSHYDTANEIWLDGDWWVSRAYGYEGNLISRSQWGGSYYTSYNDLILVAGPNWEWDLINVNYEGVEREDYYTERYESINPPRYPHYPGSPANAISEIKKWDWVQTPINEYWGRQPATVIGDCSASGNNGCEGGPVGYPRIVPFVLPTQPELATIGSVLRDYGVDLDSDGRFDQLVAEVEVEVYQAGHYTIEAILNDIDPTTRLGSQVDAVDWFQERLYLEPGNHTIPLTFNGLSIAQKEIVGPYILDQVLLTDLEYSVPGQAASSDRVIDIVEDDYAFGAYSLDQFETFGAKLTKTYQHQTRDLDGDGFFDRLLLETGLEVTLDGVYRVEADLVDHQGNYLTTGYWEGAQTRTSASDETQGGLPQIETPYQLFLPVIMSGIASSDDDISLNSSVTLIFDAFFSQTTPYHITNVRLYDAEGRLIDFEEDQAFNGLYPYSTGTLYQNSGIALLDQQEMTSNVTSTSVDLDQDGDIDRLDFVVEKSIVVAGDYRVEAWLESSNGALIAKEMSDLVSLTPGQQSFTLSFDGSQINAFGANGPYKLVALKTLFGSSGYQVLDTVNVVYETDAFVYSEFDQAQDQAPQRQSGISTLNGDLVCALFNSTAPDFLGEITHFTNESIGENLSFEWNFGDGSPPETSFSPSHTYGSAGNYTVWMTATNTSATYVTSGTVNIDDAFAPTASFTTTSPDALGHTTQFTNNSIGGFLSYEWAFGDGTTSTAEEPTHIYIVPGTYTVVMTATNGIGSSTISEQVVITPSPVQGGEELYITFASGTSFNLGSVTGINNEDIVRYNGTDFEMIFDGSDVGVTPSVDAFKILDETTILLSVRADTILGGLAVDDADVVQFSATSLGETTVGTFSMYFDGSDVELDTSSEDIDGFDILDDGRLLISVSGNPAVTGLSGLRDEDILAFTPSSLGDTTAGTWALYLDAGDVSLTTSNEGINGLAQENDGYLYLSTVGSFSVSGLNGADEDVFRCELTNEGANTSCNYDSALMFDGHGFGLSGNEIDGLDYSGLGGQPPVASFTHNSPNDVGEVTNFTNATIGLDVTYEWNFGDGVTSSATSPSHIYTLAGDYSVVMTATNSHGIDSYSDTVTIVDKTPVAQFSYNSPINLGESTTFTNESTGTNLTYSWNFGDGSLLETIENPAHTYVSAGIYTVILTVENSAGLDQFVDIVTVTDPPEVISDLVATNDSPTVVGGTTTLAATVQNGTDVNYLWTFGDGENGSGATVTHNYAQPGVYTASVFASNGVSSEIAITVVTIADESPVAIFNSSTPDELGEVTNFTNSSTGTNLSYEWSFGDGASSTAINPTHTYAETGLFTVLMTATNSAGTSTMSDQVSITTPPVQITPQLYLTLGSGGSYDIGAVIGVQNEDIVRYDGTDFEMVFDGSDLGVIPSIDAFKIVDETTILMSFRSGTTVGGLTVSDTDIVQFDATSLGETTAGTFSLYFDGSDVDLTTSSEDVDGFDLLEDGRLLISTTGNPSVSGLLSLRDEDILAFTPSSLGENTAGIWSMYFDAGDVGLTTSNEGINGLAYTDDGLVLSTVGSFAVTGLSGDDEDVFVCDLTSEGNTTACTYEPALMFDGDGFGLSGNEIDGLDYSTGGAPSEPAPVAGFTSTSPDELGEVTNFTNTTIGSNVTYQWSFGDGSTSNQVNPAHTYLTTGTFTVVMIATNSGGSDTSTQVVTITPPAEPSDPIEGLSASNDGPTELGQSTLFSTSLTNGTNVNYLWSFGDGQNGTGATVNHSYAQPGTYTASVFASNELSNELATTVVTVVDVPPVAIFGSSGPNELGEATSFTNSSTGTNLSYVWSFGDGATSNAISPTHTYATTGTFTVLMTATNSVGESTMSDQVVITTPPAQTTPYLYLTFSSGGSYDVGAVTGVQNEDIVRYDGTDFEMVFDGSDVGITPSIDAFKILDEDTILLSVRADITLGGLAVDDADIVQFDATSLGETTAGTFSMYFDGSDVEFDTSSEDIDGFDLLEDGRLLMSVSGNPGVTGLSSLRDEDILAFTPSSLGDNTAGTWSMYFEGSDVDLTTSSEDVNGLAYTTDGNLYLSTIGTFAISGVGGEDEDIFSCELTSEGAVTACTYDPALIFDGDSFGLSSLEIDGLDYSTGGGSSSEPAPVAGFTSSSPDEVGEVTSFTNTTTGSNVSYQWSFGDGTTSTAADPNHSYALAGNYTVVMTATNSSGNDTISATVTITEPVTPEPINGLAASNDGPTELGQDTLLSVSVTSGTNVDYAWNFGDGQLGTGASPSHSYAAVGTYTATVTATNSENSEVATTIVTIVDAPPVAIFSSSSPDNVGQVTSFTNSSLGTNLSYTWNFGDGAMSAQENPTHTYASEGPFTVLMTATNSAGSSTMSDQVIIQTATPAQEILYLTIVEGGSFTFGSVTGVQNEDIVSYDENDFAMVFDGSDVGVTGSIDAFHIVDEDTILFSVRAATTLGGLAVADADIVQFDATSLGETTAGTFSLYFDGSDVDLTDGGEDIDGLAVLEDGRLLISTNGNPSVTGLSSLRDEDILAFTPSSLGTTTSGTWAMYFDAGDVGLTTSDEGITGIALTSENELYLSTRGNFAVSGLSGADEDIFKCSLTSEGATTICTFDPTFVLDGSEVGLGSNDIEGLSLLGQSSSELAPTAGFSTSSPDELGQVTSFTNSTTGNNVSYEWSFGDGAISTAENPTHTYAVDGTFTVVMTATNSGGSDKASHQVVIEALSPVDDPITGMSVDSSSPTELSQSTAFSVTVSGGTNVSYDWNLGDGTVIVNGSTNVRHTYSQTGTYTVVATATNEVGSETASTTVKVVDPAPPPADDPINGMSVDSSSPTEIGQSTAFSVTVTGGTNISYDWNFGDGTVVADGGANISYIYGQTGNYTVLVTGTNNVGTTTANTAVTIDPLSLTLLGPADNSTQAQPQFDWEDVTGATNYQIQISDSNDFSNLLIDQNVTESDYSFISIQTGQYFWRVIVNDGPADGLQSEVRSMQLVNYNGDDDGDILPNGWELHGYDAENDGTLEVNLPALGANYRHKDIFVEMDYMERASAANGLAPNQNVINQITAIFANAPVSNPDGVDGINIHLELDDLVPYDESFAWEGGDLSEFIALKDTYYDTHNQKIYHYMIWANRYNNHNTETPVTIGVSSRVPGEFFFVSLGHFNGGDGGTDTQKVAAFVHELGHNLGFGHGGENTRNYKPNYFSVMNYWWALDGIPDGTNKIDYQGFTLPTLDESNLDETVGLNGGGLLTGYTTSYYCPNGSTQTVAADGPIDWNCDGDDTDTGIQVDLNDDGNINSLSSQNDWDSIVFDGGNRLGP